MPVLIRGIFSGGGKIKDATALPSDVAKGKVFYNNDGKQIGTNEPLKAYKYVIDTSKYPNKIDTSVYKNFALSILYISDNSARSAQHNEFNNSYTISVGISKILSITVNGVKFDVCGSKKVPQIYLIKDNTEQTDSYSHRLMVNTNGDILFYTGQYAPKRIIEIEYLK